MSGPVVWFLVLSRRNLADPARRSSPNPRLFTLLRTLLRSEKTQLFHDQANPHSFCKTPGVGVPLRGDRCTEAQKCPSVSPLSATLTDSVSRKSFPCHSYENTRDGGVTPPPKSFSPLVYSERLWQRATRPSPLALTPFRINTCKSVSKQTTLTSFRINTYEKHPGRGVGLFCFRHHMRRVSPLSPCPHSIAHTSCRQRGVIPWAIGRQKAKGPALCDGASAMNRNGLLAEVIDEATLDAQVVLFCASKMGVQILELDRTERHVGRQLNVCTAAERHCKRVRRRRRETRCACRRPFAAEQHLRVRSQAAVRAIRQPRPEQVVDFMRGGARLQAGDSAAPDVADKSEPVIHTDPESPPP